MSLNICNYCGGAVERHADGWRCPVCKAMARHAPEEESALVHEAFQKLRFYEFGEAKKKFEDVILRYPQNPEGYWGRLMSKYEIRYRWDGTLIDYACIHYCQIQEHVTTAHRCRAQ